MSTTIVITSASFKAGQDAANRDAETDPDSTPNYDLLARLRDDEFAAGYRYEWENFISLMRAFRR